MPQLVVQCIGKCRQTADELADFRRPLGVAGQGDRLPGQGTGIVEQGAPQLPAFPKAVVTRVVPKAQKDRQGNPEQGEGRGVERNLEMIHIPLYEYNAYGKHKEEQEPGEDLRQYRAPPDKQHQKPVLFRPDNHNPISFCAALCIPPWYLHLPIPYALLWGLVWRCHTPGGAVR